MTDRNDERSRLGRDRSPGNTRPDPENASGSSRPTGSDDPGSYRDSRDTASPTGPGDRDKGTIDRLIDKAQEKGLLDKAEKMIRDRFGGGRRR